MNLPLEIDSSPKETEKGLFLNSEKYYLENRTYENCLKCISEHKIYANEIIECSVTRKNRESNEFYLTTSDSILLLNTNLLKLKENIVLTQNGDLLTFYLTIKDSFSNLITYESIYKVFSLLRDILLERNIKQICCVKTDSFFQNLEFIKVKQILRYIFKNSEIEFTIFIDNLIHLTDKDEIERVISETHNSLTGTSHQGIKRTILKLKEIYCWKHMKKDISNYIKKCEICQKNKMYRNIREPLTITTTSKTVNEKVLMDVIGPFNETEKGYNCILTMQDDLSTYMMAVPMVNQNAVSIAKAFVENWICIFSTPTEILTDNGRAFISDLMKKVCKLLQIQKVNISAYRPQSNTIERQHRGIKDFIKAYCNENLNNWDECLPYAVFTYNTNVNLSTEMTPHELMFGKPANMPSSVTNRVDIVYNYDDYFYELRHKLQTAHRFARDNLIKSKMKNKEYYDRKLNPSNFDTGDMVLLRNHTNSKLGARYDGPYEIIEIVSPTNTKIKISAKENRIVHNNHLKKFYK